MGFLIGLFLLIGVSNGLQGDAHIFTLHRIGPADGTDTVISPRELITLLQYCREQNYTIITISQLVELIREKRPFDKVVIFTFDDGYKSVYKTALPIFKFYRAKFNLLLYVKAIQNRYRSYLNWREVQELQEAGIEIGFHSYRHPNFLKLTPVQMEEDLNRSIAVMGNNLSHFFYFFAYPYDLSSFRTDRIVVRFFPILLNGDSIPVNRFTPLYSLPRYECFGKLGRFKWILKQKYLPVRLAILPTSNGVWIKGKVYGDFIPPFLYIKLIKGIRKPLVVFGRWVKLKKGKFRLFFNYPVWGMVLHLRYKNYFWQKRL